MRTIQAFALALNLTEEERRELFYTAFPEFFVWDEASKKGYNVIHADQMLEEKGLPLLTARVIVLLLFALFCFSRCYHDLLLPFDIPVAQWEGIHLLGPSHVQTADIRFLTSVLDDPAFITAEVLYRFGALPCALLLISFAILLARLIDDKQKGTYSIRVRTACFVLFTSRLVIHLLSVVVLISRGDQVAQTYMPLTGSNCAVMAEFALIIWIFLGNHIWKHDNAPS